MIEFGMNFELFDKPSNTRLLKQLVATIFSRVWEDCKSEILNIKYVETLRDSFTLLFSCCNTVEDYDKMVSDLPSVKMLIALTEVLNISNNFFSTLSLLCKCYSIEDKTVVVRITSTTKNMSPDRLKNFIDWLKSMLPVNYGNIWGVNQDRAPYNDDAIITTLTFRCK